MRSKLIIIIALALVALALVLRRREREIIVMPDGVRIQKADPRDAAARREKFEEWYS